LPPGRVADPDRRGHRLGIVDRMSVNERRGPRRLVPVEDRGGLVLLESLPIRGDVPRVADGDRERPGWTAQLVADLEGGRLLPLDPVRVDRVDELDRVRLG